MHPIALIGTSILGLLLFGLGLNVSRLRGKFHVGAGYPDDQTHPLHRAVRAHGNTAEFAPFFAVLLLYLGSCAQPMWVLVVMALAVLSRVLQVVGMLSCKTLARPSPLRFAGSLGTYVTGIVLSAVLLLGL